MKTKVTLLALALLTTGMALAQAPAAPPAGPDSAERMDRLALLLDLDSYQKTELEKVLKEQHEKMRSEREAARASGAERPSREEMSAKRDQYKQELHTKLSGFLNETQIKKFDALHEGRGFGPGPGRHFGGKKEREAKDETKTTN
ncbi:MAG: hypothetical protein ABW171_04825 [Steroidobacter sp.]